MSPTHRCLLQGLKHTARLRRKIELHRGADKSLVEATEPARGGDSLLVYLDTLWRSWHPPYLTVLPEACLDVVFRSMSMVDVLVCLRVCKRWNASILRILKMQPRSKLASTHATTTNSDHVNKLPDELLVDIFDHLEIEDLLACRESCQRWSRITSDTSALWSGKGFLSGTFAQSREQLSRLHTLCGRSGIRSLQISAHKKDPDEFDRGSRNLFDDFPTWSLRQLTLHAEYYCPLWKREISESKRDWSQLETLGYLLEEGDKFPWSPSLAACRLKELFLSAYDDDLGESYMTDSFYDMISQAERITINFTLQYESLYRILNAAKDTLKYLYLTRTPEGFLRSKPDLVMKNLTELRNFFPTLPLTMCLRLPRITKLSLRVQCQEDLKILQGLHQNTLEDISLRIQTAGYGQRYGEDDEDEEASQIQMHEILEALQTVLYTLPACRSLSIDLQRYFLDDQAEALFYEMFAQGVKGSHRRDRMRQCLPSLEKLSFVFDDYGQSGHPDSEVIETIGEYLLAFLADRDRVGLSRLEELLLARCEHFNPDLVRSLGDKVKRITFCADTRIHYNAIWCDEICHTPQGHMLIL
jgi:hypothetical protein